MTPIELDYLPHLPPKTDYRIGVVGAGFIVREVHLAAHRKAGFDVVAIASRTPAHAQAVAEQWGIPRVYDSYRDLLADPEIEIVDLAFPPDRQLEVIQEAVRHTDHLCGILAQKPLTLTARQAREIVDRCARAWDDPFTWSDDAGIHWRVEGTEGIARGTIGWPDYPLGSPSTLDDTLRAEPGVWHRPRWEERWFPDAFVGTMG